MLFECSHTSLCLIAVFAISVICVGVYNRLSYYSERKVSRKVQQLYAQLSLILDACKTDVWTYNTRKNRYKLISKKDLTETRYTSLEFAQFFDSHDYLRLQQAIADIQSRKKQSCTLTVKSSTTSNEPERFYELSLSVLHTDHKDNPYEILGTQRDMTEEKLGVKKNRHLMLRYQNVFNSSLVDMLYYDADGTLADLNDKACETFGISDRQKLLKRKVNLRDIPSYRDFDLQQMEHTQLSSITDITKVKQQDERVPELTKKGKIYYEVMMEPIHDRNNQLQGVITAGRDITEMVESTHRQKEWGRLIEKRNREIQQYIKDLDYSLKVSEARLMNYYPDQHLLEVLTDMNNKKLQLPQLRTISLIHPDYQKLARKIINKMDRRQNETLTATLLTNLKDKQQRKLYLNVNMMPILDQDGQVSHYFGMCRNDSELAYTEKRLEEETAKAQEEEQLKITFLLNMSYELRVPLHAVIGFADLFKTEHSQEDEPVFASEIKKNTDVLLSLINDILFISRLDAHMIEYNYEVHDLARLFDGWCTHGWSESGTHAKQVIANTFSSLMVKIDKHNLGIAIEKLCHYVGLSADTGLIKARYEYLHDKLIIIVDSTEGGMEQEEAMKAFDRFNGNSKHKRIGTGLDLAIVRGMIELMGGRIDVLSEPDKGFSFFISLPCERVDFERNLET